MTLAATDASLEKFGRYTLLKPIASGGMAEVHLASFAGAAGVQKLVAIKRILAEHARDAEFVAMFMNEARIAASLHHANVVDAYDFGCEGGRYFLAMEYLRGQDVRRVGEALARARRPMPLEIAIAIGIGSAAGLHYLHEKRDAAGQPLGLVHRDVSPPNILLTTDGIVKLVDFGIAKAVLRAAETRTGTLKGKVSYLSPEQCRSEPLDRCSDVFSLAIVLWELTVGRRLYQGDSDLLVMNAIDKLDAPRPSRMVPRYPRELERILMKGLARDRGRRYQSAAQMQEDLEAFARADRLAVTQGSVSAFVRSVGGDDHLTIAGLETDTDLAHAAPPPAEPPSHRGGAGRTRQLEPRLSAAPALSGPDTLARRRGAVFAALGALAALVGLGALLLAMGQHAPAVAPTARAAVGNPPEVAPARPSPTPPAVAPEPLAAPVVGPDAHLDAPPPVAHPNRERARRARSPGAPASSPATVKETWSPDSALPPL